MATLLSGLAGGLLASIVTGAATVTAGDEPLPSAVVWAKYLGDGIPDHYGTHGVAVHVVYGALAGAAFVAVVDVLALDVATLAGAVLWGVVWSAALLAFAVGFWLVFVLGDRPEPRTLALLALVHLAFGVVLGLFVYAVPSL